MKYYIGTTIENLVSIIEGGAILKQPPHRVWVDYSEDYVYLVPRQEYDDFGENGNFEETDNHQSLEFAFEQADFAVYELSHTRRVVLEIEGIQEDLLTKDKDAECIGAVKYPLDIPVDCIKRVFVDQENFSESINAYIALSKYFEKYHEKTYLIDDYNPFLNCYDEDGNYVEPDQEYINSELIRAENELEIDKLSEVIMHSGYSDSSDLESLLEDLREEVDLNLQFNDYFLEEFKYSFSEMFLQVA